MGSLPNYTLPQMENNKPLLCHASPTTERNITKRNSSYGNMDSGTWKYGQLIPNLEGIKSTHVVVFQIRESAVRNGGSCSAPYNDSVILSSRFAVSLASAEDNKCPILFLDSI